MKTGLPLWKIWRWSFLTLIATLVACNGGTPPDDSRYAKNGHFISARHYVSEQPGGGRCLVPEGCFAHLDFATDGTGTLIFTDIANAVSYKIANNTLTATLIGLGDIPSTVQFDILDNAKTLVRRDSGAIFTLQPATVSVYRSAGARACEANTGIRLSDSEKLLSDASISVQSSSCGYLTNLVLPAVCGITTNKVYVHVIDIDQLAAAEKLGFTQANQTAANTVATTACSTN